MYEYFHRIVDELLQEKLDAMAVLVEGPKYCGKKPLPFNVQAVILYIADSATNQDSLFLAQTDMEKE